MTLNFAAVQDVLNVEFQEPLSDQIARSNPMLAGINKRSLQTQRIFLKNEAASTHEAAPVADGSVITVGSPTTTFSQGILDWSTYKATFKVNKRVLAQTADQPAALGMLFGNEVMNAAKDLADRIAADMFLGVTANGLVGLQTIFDEDRTYAGIDSTTAPYWDGNVVDAAGAALSTDLMYDVEEAFFGRTLYDFYSARVNGTGFLSKRMQRIYKNLFESIDYSSLSTAHFVNQANASGQLGRTAVGFNGTPFIPDVNSVPAAGDTADTDRIYFVDTNEIFLAGLTPGGDPGVRALQEIDAAQYAEPLEGLPVSIEILGNQGEFVAGYVKTYIQLVCPRPGFAGVVLKNVSNTIPAPAV